MTFSTHFGRFTGNAPTFELSSLDHKKHIMIYVYTIVLRPERLIRSTKQWRTGEGLFMTIQGTLLAGTAIVALTLFPSAPTWSQSANPTPVAEGQVRDSGSADPQVAQAQPEAPPPDDGMEEMIVTAQRRAESVQDVPIAISAFSATDLERRQINETLDLINYVPNLIGANNTGLGTANQYYIRALGNTETIATFDPPVGTYVDDIYISRQNANNFAFFDIDRIEVLRGPQGTLFGRNTTGGAVNVILKKPAETFGGFAEAGYGKYQEYTVRASIDVPVTPRLLTKLSGFRIDNDGWAENLTTGEDNNIEETYGVRGAVRWLVSDTVTLDVAADYIDSQNENLLNTEVDGERVTRTGLTRQGGALRPFLFGEKGDFGLGNFVKNYSFSSNLEIETDIATISIISGYRNLRQDFALDFANLPRATGGFVIANIGEHEQFSQEIKINGSFWNDRVDYVAGLYYIFEDNRTDFADLLNFAAPVVLADRVLENTTEARAAFTQFDVHLLPSLTATAGVRFTSEDKEIEFTPNPNPRTAGGFDTADLLRFGVPTELAEGIWTPRFAIEYGPKDNVLLFVSATRGFKSGGWNARGTSAEVVLDFGPETVWSYEAGIRSDWFDNRLRVNMNYFFSDVSDFQVPSAFQASTGAITFVTQNFADLDVQGFEAELTWAPLDGLTLNATLGWQNAIYRDPDPSVLAQQARCLAGIASSCGQGIVTPQGEIAEPVRAPDVNFTFNASYQIPVNRYLLTPSASVTYVSDHFIQTSNVAAGFEDGYTVVNAGLYFEPTDGDWSISAGCNNCTNERYVTSFLIGQYFNRPVTWMTQLRYRF